ncbi:MAG: hypothetical protein AAF485_26320 [Chloroflexota bacterium]
MKRYTHKFQVKSSVQSVAEFHKSSDSMGAITPPPLIVQIHSAPSILKDGDIMDFSLWFGPIPIRWTAQIGDSHSSGFVDRQRYGPFRFWTHRHTFRAIDEDTTEVIDQIEFDFKRHPIWGPVGISMWLTLPILFAYRGWMTRRLLERIPVARFAYTTDA